jgi:Uma2 family endonuclease
MSIRAEATVEDLYHLPEDRKAELVNGKIVEMAPTGFLPNCAAGEIFASLRQYSRDTGRGIAITDNAGFLVDLPNRSSFSPDAAYYMGKPTGMRFLEGAPSFAVEVRSAGDYDPQAEQEIAQKRADYFAAGTLVVWDVDLLSSEVVRVYRSSSPTLPTVYGRRERAEAEPAVPGWRMAVNDLFPNE